MRRSVAFLRSDYFFAPVANQCMSYGLAFWLPYTGTGTGPGQFSLYELRSNLSCPKDTPCWDVRDPHLPYDFRRKVVREWRGYADDYLFGDFYPITPYSLEANVWMVWQFNRPDAGEGVVQGFRCAGSRYEAIRAGLQGLDPKARYQLTNLDEAGSEIEESGGELMSEGISRHIKDQPGTVVLTYRKPGENK